RPPPSGCVRRAAHPTRAGRPVSLKCPDSTTIGPNTADAGDTRPARPRSPRNRRPRRGDPGYPPALRRARPDARRVRADQARPRTPADVGGIGHVFGDVVGALLVQVVEDAS